MALGAQYEMLKTVFYYSLCNLERKKYGSKFASILMKKAFNKYATQGGWVGVSNFHYAALPKKRGWVGLNTDVFLNAHKKFNTSKIAF